MKKIWKDKWVKALRSGEYEQGKDYLCKEGKSHDSFCCLGVLCDIVWPGKWEYEDGVGVFKHQERYNQLPPCSVLDKVGLLMKTAETLAEMNDTGKKFSAIANYIEKHL
jgi:hypothetical protein